MVQDEAIPALISRTNELTKRLRVLEEEFSAFQEKMDDLLQSFMKRTKDDEKKLEDISSAFSSVIKDVLIIKNELKEIKKSLVRFAPSEKVEELEGFINLLNPMESVTREEVRKIVQEEMRGGTA